jgi:hypothetical protein
MGEVAEKTANPRQRRLLDKKQTGSFDRTSPWRGGKRAKRNAIPDAPTGEGGIGSETVRLARRQTGHGVGLCLFAFLVTMYRGAGPSPLTDH